MPWNPFGQKENKAPTVAEQKKAAQRAPMGTGQSLPPKSTGNGVKRPAMGQAPAVNRVPLRKPPSNASARPASAALPAPSNTPLSSAQPKQPVRLPQGMQKGRAEAPRKEQGTVYPLPAKQLEKQNSAERPQTKLSPPSPQNVRPLPPKRAMEQQGQRLNAGRAVPLNHAQNAPKAPKPPKAPKSPRGPIITAEGVRQTLYVLLMSILIYSLVCGATVGIFYAVNNVHFNFGYDVTVELDKSQKKNEKYEMDSASVFRSDSNQPYISLSRLAPSLGLSCVGNEQRIRFYKTDDLSCYVSLEHNSRQAIINGESIRLSDPIVIAGNTAYVPIGLFNYYASGVHIEYDYSKRQMKVVYEINQALSTPKRKVLQEFLFSVCAPAGIAELTEEEWFEYVGSRA